MARSALARRAQVSTLALMAALALGAGASRADVTPEDVWQNWQDSMAAQGQKVTAEATETEGDTLVVSGIKVEMSGEGGTSSALIGEIRFRDKGDGTVAIVMPDSFPVLLTVPPTPGEEAAGPQELKLTVTMPGAETTASGVPAALSYATKAPSVEVAAEVTEDAETIKFLAKLAGVTGNYLIEAAESGQDLTQDFAATSVDVTLDVTGDPASEGKFTLSLAGVGGKAEMTGIPASGMADLEAALKDGMTMDMTANYGVGSFDLTAKEAGQPFKMTGALGGGSFVIGFGANHFAYDAKGKSVSLNFSGTDTATGKPMTFSATLADTASRLAIEGSNWMAAGEFEDALKAGLKMSGGLGLGPTSFDFVGEDAAGPTSVKASLGGLDTGFAMEAKAVEFDIDAKAVELSVASPDIPLPEAALSVTEVAMDFAMPLSKSDAPAPFNLLTKVVDLDLGDSLWMMLDGAGMLPHDPATFILDTKGTATLLADMSAMETAMEGAPPQMLLNSLDLSQLLLRLAGAEVTGAGAFTFDSSDMTTVPGMPLPTGKLDLKAVGVNGLMDKLVAMGMVPEAEATNMRMMATMFANTDPNKDEMTSVLEFKDGHFYANGQMLQ